MGRRPAPAAAVLFLGTCAICLAAPLAAQRVTGRVVNAVDTNAVSGALVALVDSGGRMLARWATESDGEYQLQAPYPGRFALWVLRIGKRPWRMDAVVLDSGATLSVTLVVPDLPLTLPPMTIGARSRCTLNPADTSLVGALLNEAEKALALAQATVDADRLHYIVETWHVNRWAWGETTDSVGSTQVGHGCLARHPGTAAAGVPLGGTAEMDPRPRGRRPDPLSAAAVGSLAAGRVAAQGAASRSALRREGSAAERLGGVRGRGGGNPLRRLQGRRHSAAEQLLPGRHDASSRSTPRSSRTAAPGSRRSSPSPGRSW